MGLRRQDGPSELRLTEVVVYTINVNKDMPARERNHAALAELVARDCIATKVRLLNRAVTAIYDEALRPYGLKVTQMTVLVTVAKIGQASPGAVGRMLHMEKSTLSRNVDRMRARGWLDRSGRTVMSLPSSSVVNERKKCLGSESTRYASGDAVSPG